MYVSMACAYLINTYQTTVVYQDKIRYVSIYRRIDLLCTIILHTYNKYATAICQTPLCLK